MTQENRKATIREVAQLAEVSVSSVSRYLADPGSVRAYAAYRRRGAIQPLGYEPNTFARGLRQGRGRTVGMVVPDLEFFYAKACRAVGDYFYERGYAVFVCSSDGDPAKEQFCVRQLQSQRVAGLIVSSSGLNPVFLEQQARQGVPLVLLDGESLPPAIWCCICCWARRPPPAPSCAKRGCARPWPGRTARRCIPITAAGGRAVCPRPWSRSPGTPPPDVPA